MAGNKNGSGKGKGQSVAIGMLERFIVDWMVENKKPMHTQGRLRWRSSILWTL